MKKFITAACAAGFLLLGSGCQQEHPITVDYSAEDDRTLDRRSAEVSGVSITLTSYSLYFSQYNGEKPSGKGYFFVVEYDLENKSEIPKSFFLDSVVVVSTTGKEYPFSEYGTAEGDGINYSIRGLKPGDIYQGIMVMEMPAGTKPDSLTFYGDSGYGQVIDITDIEGEHGTN